MEDEIGDVEEGLEVVKNRGMGYWGRRLEKGVEKGIEKMKVKVKRIMKEIKVRKEDRVDFGRMGMEDMFVDE